MRSLPGDADGDPEPDAGDVALRVFLDSSREAILITNALGTIVATSPPALDLLRLPEEAARGLDVRTFFSDLPEAPTREATTLEATRADGTSLTVELTASRFGQEGSTLVALVLRDITPRVQRDLDAKLDRRSLEDAIESLQAFSSVVSHDLKEPVRALGAYLEEAGAAETLDEARERVSRALLAHENFRRLLDGLLEWSRTATMPVEPVPVDVAELLADPACRTQFENLLVERGVTLDVDPHLPAVDATPSLLSRVLGNLITNAIRHNPRQDPRVEIRALEGQRAGRVTLVVDDNGPGFPPAVLSSHAAAGGPATLKRGVGLAIAQRAAERLGGSLRLTNRSEGGGRALVTLPTPSRIRTLEDRIRELI